MSNQEPKPNLSINEKITDLNRQVQWFYSDDFSLDFAEKNFKAAISLVKDIESDLNSLKNEIEILARDFTS